MYVRSHVCCEQERYLVNQDKNEQLTIGLLEESEGGEPAPPGQDVLTPRNMYENCRWQDRVDEITLQRGEREL
ncbi:hypothetical protein RRF57_011054 [Xylaria bambusicola]|uniref:Uncharacterized protein n=1 Tax=Xylaria bambusicola TaxID=326684 RepID=A0AAN7Z9C6_9PEZI